MKCNNILDGFIDDGNSATATSLCTKPDVEKYLAFSNCDEAVHIGSFALFDENNFVENGFEDDGGEPTAIKLDTKQDFEKDFAFFKCDEHELNGRIRNSDIIFI